MVELENVARFSVLLANLTVKRVHRHGFASIKTLRPVLRKKALKPNGYGIIRTAASIAASPSNTTRLPRFAPSYSRIIVGGGFSGGETIKGSANWAHVLLEHLRFV
jgi:hypothetical protein